MQASRIAKFKAACAAADVDCDGFDMKCAKVKMGICDGKPTVQYIGLWLILNQLMANECNLLARALGSVGCAIHRGTQVSMS